MWGSLSFLTAKSFRSDIYSILFDRQVQQWFEGQHADLVRTSQDGMHRLYEFEGDADKACRAAAVAEVAQEMIHECVAMALCRCGWQTPASPLYRFERRLGLGILCVNFNVLGPLDYRHLDYSHMGSSVRLYNMERIELHIHWSATLAVRAAAPMVANEMIGAVAREIEDEFHRAGWRYDAK